MILYLQVISSMIPNDDFGGFEPLRLQVRMTTVPLWIKILLSAPPYANRLLHRYLVSMSPRWMELSEYYHQSHSNIINLSYWEGNTIIEQHLIVKLVDVWLILSFHYLLGILDTCVCGSLTWLAARDSWLCREGPWCFYSARRTGMGWQLSYMMDRWGEREAESKMSHRYRVNLKHWHLSVGVCACPEKNPCFSSQALKHLR